MNEHLYPLVRLVSSILMGSEVRFALVGGLAFSLRTQPRFTRDADFALAVATDAEAEAAAHVMFKSGFPIAVTLDNTRTGRLATVRLRGPEHIQPQTVVGEQPYVDLLCTTCGIEPEVVADATPFEVEPGLNLPIACVPHLMAMKLLSASRVRKQDYVDLDDLIAEADDADLRRTRELLALIHERDYHRGLDLHARYDALLAEHGRHG